MREPYPGNENRFAVVQASGDDGKDRVQDPLSGSAPQRIGWFRFYFDDDRWEWSPQVEKMHGYLPGSVTPTTELVLAHKHPDDYRQIADTLDLIRQSRQAFSSRHRIIDVQGRVHHVVVARLISSMAICAPIPPPNGIAEAAAAAGPPGDRHWVRPAAERPACT